ncbi:hypothetical protein Dimus_013468 [Dionaea muscipula]
MAVVPVVEREERQEKPSEVAEKEEQVKNIKGKGKVGDVKSEKDALPLFLHSTILSSAGPAAPKVLSYSTPKWHILLYPSMLQPGQHKKLKEALRLEWTRGATTTKDEEISRNLTDDALNQWIAQAENILWGEASRRREENEKLIQDFVFQHETLKSSYKKAMNHDLERDQEAEKNEKLT